MMIIYFEPNRTFYLKNLCDLSRNKYVAEAENYMHPEDKKQSKKHLPLKSLNFRIELRNF